ncbi:ABC transporter permease [Glaciibacter superstes]|uniref:ABC transporter permease n=1 Tax=Glaciibacter superstes TaxID=501023 RepID=UPI000403EEE8|nr:ABC transporter permease [Glaciibacter superstes]
MSVTTAVEPVIPDYGQASECVVNNGAFCVDWFVQQWPTVFWPALVEHIGLTLIAIVIGFVLAFLAALVAHRFSVAAAPLNGIAAVLYTIPPLALFILLVPFTGLSVLTAEIALVAYTLLILFSNTLTGLNNIPADARRAAVGMGLTRSQILKRIELPLAVPAIIGGLRIASVLTVSTATIAAFIVDAGLGSPILKAIQSPFNTQFIAAGALAVLLAFAVDGLLVLLGRGLAPWALRRRNA